MSTLPLLTLGALGTAVPAPTAPAGPVAATATTTTAVSPTPSARLHLVAALAILDHWAHRNEDCERVVGALVGTRSTDGSGLEIADAFPLVLLDDDESVDVDFAATMAQLRRRTNAKEQVLGWYATGRSLDPKFATGLHEWIDANLVASATTTTAAPTTGTHAIHLVVDTSLETDDVAVQAFVGVPVASLADDGNAGRLFVPMPVAVAPAPYELTALECIATAALPINDNLARIVPRVEIPQAHGRVAKLDALLDACSSLVHDTLEDLQGANGEVTVAKALALNTLGHRLRATIASRTLASDRAAGDAEVRDLKTVIELAQLAKKQMSVGELIVYGSAIALSH
ncbi:hypothetical protein BC828DRAFT_417221 [Blastocladiella britannica]|nr:hypothetical protein BC828DRAFT_417221 [Blastocladiella britannica]